MSDKVRVYEIAEEAGTSSSDVIAKAKDLNIDLKSPQSAVSYEEAEEITNYIMTGISSRIPRVIKKKKPFGNDGLIDIIKVLNPNSHKAIPKDKVKIVSKGNQKDIVLIESKEYQDITEVILNGIPEIEPRNKTIPKDSSGNKQKIIINRYPNVIIEINNLKSIDYLRWELQKEKGVYGIIGENGTGKSSLLICIAKLVNGSIFQNELVGVGHYDNTKITYIINDKKINFIKNEITNNNWRQEKTDRYALPDMDGFFESSILSGNRFNKLNNYIKKELEYIPSEDIIRKADKFIIDEMNYILYENEVHLYRFNELYEINAIRKHRNNLVESKYNYYALKLGDNRYLKEQILSTGEYFLLQILKYINKHVNKQHHISPLIIIDEIELSLHPLAQERLINRLNEYSESFNLIVLFATHSLHIIENIKNENRFYIRKNKLNQIKVETNVDIGYLTSKLYKHQFFDYIFLVEDRMAKKYLKLVLNNEITNIANKNIEIISTGGADKVFELNRENLKYKYFGEAKVYSIPDADKESDFDKYENQKFKKIFIPIKPNIESFIYEKYFNNEYKFISDFESFINKKYYNDTRNKFQHIFSEEKNSKKFVKDICCKIVYETQDTKDEKTSIYLSNMYKEDFVDFIYPRTKETIEYKQFIGVLNHIFN